MGGIAFVVKFQLILMKCSLTAEEERTLASSGWVSKSEKVQPRTDQAFYARGMRVANIIHCVHSPRNCDKRVELDVQGSG